MSAASQSIEAVATSINWVGYWGAADFEGSLRGDALAWSGDDVRRFVASGGRDLPGEEVVDTEDSPCPYTGAGASWNMVEAPTPWWVEAQSHTEGPPDDESIPRKIEGWWRVVEYSRDRQTQVGEDLEVDELCFVEKLWSDRIRVFKAGLQGSFGVVPLSRVCDLQLMKSAGSHVGAKWDLLRDIGEGGDDPDDIRVGQKRRLLGGEYGALKMKGMECEIVNYVEWMDRWTVEIPVKDAKGKNMCVAVSPGQLREPKMPREPRPNGHVNLGLALRVKALELAFQDADLAPESEAAMEHPAGKRVSFSGENGNRRGDGHFRLKLRFVSRVRPGGRVWTSCEESMYKYVEVRYIAGGDYGMVFRVLRMVDPTKKVLEEDEEDPYVVLDVARGSDKNAITKAYRKLAKRWHPDKVPEAEREQAVVEFRRAHLAYENLLADPERSSDLMVLKMQNPADTRKIKRIPIPMAFQTEVRCLSLVSQLRLPNVNKLVEVGPDNQFIVIWPYLPEALLPSNEPDGVNQVDRVDLVRQGWSDYSRSRRTAQRVLRTMIALIRHDVMIVDPMQNIIIDRESGQPLFIDFGRGETAGSIYTTRIKTFMKKILTLLVRSVSQASYDIAARFIRDLENTLFEELERWQDEKTRDQKKAIALVTSSTKWQEGIECCREIWTSPEENPFRKMFKEQADVLPTERKLREARELEDVPDSDEENPAQEEDDDPDGLCDADINTLTPVQRLLRAKRKKGRRAKLPKERPNATVTVEETLADGTLGLGLDDADEDSRGVVVVQINKKAERYGWQIGDRIIQLNGKDIDEWDDFRLAWEGVKQFGDGSAVFGVVRFGVELPPETKEPKCLNCGSKGKHLQRCSTWKPLPEGEACVYFCSRDCQRAAWRSQKKEAAPAA
mmetsp:Transcript_96485/g.268133  ORF Transcript_96485/g.268133 Transcript_96485/m.268133 type:complete len:897 (+) Transcript_96485:61-2751(+)